MPIARVYPPMKRRMTAAASILGVAAVVAWMTATAFGQGAPVTPPLAPAQVLVSIGTLDMSRLVPAQFGDWDAAAPQPTR